MRKSRCHITHISSETNQLIISAELTSYPFLQHKDTCVSGEKVIHYHRSILLYEEQAPWACMFLFFKHSECSL